VVIGVLVGAVLCSGMYSVRASIGSGANETLNAQANRYLTAYQIVEADEQRGLPAIRVGVGEYVAHESLRCSGVAGRVNSGPTEITWAERELSREALDAVALTAVDGVARLTANRDQAAADTIERFHWSDLYLERLERTLENEEREWRALPVPDVCKNVKEWASLAFPDRLPRPTVRFLRRWYSIEHEAMTRVYGQHVQVIDPTSFDALIIRRLRRYTRGRGRELCGRVEKRALGLNQALSGTILTGADEMWRGLGLSRTGRPRT
jgi:hypothetical protein